MKTLYFCWLQILITPQPSWLIFILYTTKENVATGEDANKTTLSDL